MAWATEKLSEVAPSRPLKVKDTNAEDEIWQLNLNHIESDTGKLIQLDSQPYSEAGSSTHWFDERHVLYSKLRPYLNKVLLPQQRGLATTELVPMLPNEKLLNRKYLAYYLRSKKFVDWVSVQTAGAKMPRVAMKVFWEHEIPLPPLAEQQKIAAILDAADQLRQKDQQLIDHYTTLSQSLFLEMFGSSNAAFNKWPVVEIKELAAPKKGSMRTGPFGSNLLHSEFINEGEVAVLGIDNAVKNKFKWPEVPRFITNQKFKELERYRIYPKDVIITIMGTIGRSAVIPDDISLAINTKHLAALTLNHGISNPLFLSFSMHSDPYILEQFRARSRGAIMSGLNLTIIKETKIRLPPITLQNQFAQHIEKIEQQKQQAQASLEKSETLFNSLLQRAFKGELTT